MNKIMLLLSDLATEKISHLFVDFRKDEVNFSNVWLSRCHVTKALRALISIFFLFG